MGDGDHSTQAGKLYSVRDARYAEAWWEGRNTFDQPWDKYLFSRKVVSVLTSRKPKAVWAHEMMIMESKCDKSDESWKVHVLNRDNDLGAKLPLDGHCTQYVC